MIGSKRVDEDQYDVGWLGGSAFATAGGESGEEPTQGACDGPECRPRAPADGAGVRAAQLLDLDLDSAHHGESLDPDEGGVLVGRTVAEVAEAAHEA